MLSAILELTMCIQMVCKAQAINNSYTQNVHTGSGQGTGHNTITPTAIVILEASIEAVCESQANRDIVSLKLAYRRCARHKPSAILLLKTNIRRA